MKARFPIGTQYIPTGKRKDVYTVTDIFYTYNSKGELVKIRYESEHLFCGQMVKDSDVVDTTIARGLIGNLADFN